MSRLEFSRATRRAIIARANGHCEACRAVLKVGEGEVDHVLPDALGGKPEAANGRLICNVCHKAKTADDIARIRKADRARDKQTGAFLAPKVKLRSAPFPKRPKRAPKQMPPARSLYVRGKLLRPGRNTEGD